MPSHLKMTAEQAKPASEHIVGYKDKLTSAGRSKKHIGDEVVVVERFFEEQRLSSLAEVRQDHIQSYASNLVARDKSNRTVQKHLTTLRSFFGWLVDLNKIAKNPTQGIAKPTPSKDRRHKRRMLSRDEWNWLAAVTQSEVKRWCMSGQARRLLYWTAIETGYRSNELRQVKKSHLRKLAGKYFISVEGAATKNGKSAKQYLSPSLAAELLVYADDRHVRYAVAIKRGTDAQGWSGSIPRSLAERSGGRLGRI